MMAEDKAQPVPTDISQMSPNDLHALIEKEGKNFVQQTEEGDIDINEYLASEQFDLPRLLNLFFAFEYFHRAGSKQANFDSRYGLLYELVYAELGKLLGTQLYGPEYVIGL
jgi:hypothetical protein